MASDHETVDGPLMKRARAELDGSKSADRIRQRTAALAAVVGTILLGLKYSAFQLTGSVAVLSDTLESIINVIAALFALGGLAAAGWPIERQAFTRGRIEFFGAAFEGGMMALAAVLIVKEAGEALIFGHNVRQLEFGLLVTIGAGLANAALGWYLLQVGRRHGSLSLVAGGAHVLADFWTSIATAVGLALVRTTGLDWLDAVVAGMVGLNLLWTGVRLVRYAASGLLDEPDVGLLERLLRAMNEHLMPGVIRIHSLRAVRSGRASYVDAHLVVPEFWTVEEAHDFATAFQHRVTRSLPAAASRQVEGRMAFHVEPCHRQFCASCEVEPCPIRVQPFAGRSWIKLEDAVQPGQIGQ